ncbi:MAG: leucyl/phenylalanyl-tRNA--protein transferase [Desulforhopalus sp.]
MPVFRLSDQIQFPPVELAEENGLLAIGGDLSPERLIMAYSRGIFPWSSPNTPLLWWFTSPRLVIFPDEFRIPKRLTRYARKSAVTITRDSAFSQVIAQCAEIRTETGEETWITPEMESAYILLHRLGFAHSIECWLDDELVGGLYGVALDKIFFGESMFSRVKCGSQFALIALVKFLEKKSFKLIDCQMTTNHLLRFGAREISGSEFQRYLKEHISRITPDKEWKNESS